jgi:phosphodiesterase/alkaline phosphatase D-like protein
MDRRTFLAGSAAIGAAGTLPGLVAAAGASPVRHILPTVSHDAMLVKVSFVEPQLPPQLMLDGTPAIGAATDGEGCCWAFLATGLAPSRDYTLTLADARGRPFDDAWSLRTFPAPGDSPTQFRLMAYTCAGGHERSESGFLPLDVRRRLLARGLAEKPDALIANGDHVYWDLRTRPGKYTGTAKSAIEYAGEFDRTLPVLRSKNERVLHRAVAPQIADLYGTLLRSTPVFFVQDDHDYFDNDEADDSFVSFPPDWFMLSAARATQRAYYPEFLPDSMRPLGLSSSAALDRPGGLSESFGTLRYGKLAEVLLYDCRRYMTLNGPSATFVPPEIEAWITSRWARSDAAHVVNVPSVPVGWSAGKWGEWYQDVEKDKRLIVDVPKPYWQKGWRAQHDRLLQAASARRDRIPLFVNGDLHAISEGRITRTGAIDLSANPVRTIITGPLGTASWGWASAFRGMSGRPPNGLELEELQTPIEQHGFLLLDFDPGKITVRFFRWDVKTQSPDDIGQLQPFRTTVLAPTA